MGKKRLQKRIAESKLALTFMSVYAIAVWLACGLTDKQWWMQFGAFGVAALLMVLLNNLNALIRIYSRMVACSFLALSCVACFLFPSVPGSIMQVCCVGSLLLLFMTYQDKEASGYTYYAFLLYGVAIMLYAHLLYFLPLLWILMATQLQSLSARTVFASLLGMITPYWIRGCLILWTGNFKELVELLPAWDDLQPSFDYSAWDTRIMATLVLLALLALTGIIHFIRQHSDDKIRTRLLYGFFTWMLLASGLMLALMPRHYDSLMRLIIINTSPLAGHFIALTGTKVTNGYCAVLFTITLLLTAYNIWTSYLF